MPERPNKKNLIYLKNKAVDFTTRLEAIEESLEAPDIRRHGFDRATLPLFAEAFFVYQLDWFERESRVLLSIELPPELTMQFRGVLALVRRIRPKVRAVIDGSTP